MDILIEQREDGSLPTVSVVVMNDEILDNCTSFPDTKEGNKKAEELFKKTIKKILGAESKNPYKIKIEADILKHYLEEGYYTNSFENSSVFITHT